MVSSNKCNGCRITTTSDFGILTVICSPIGLLLDQFLLLNVFLIVLEMKK